MNLKDLFENIDREQRRVGQLPADFRPPQTSPQLSGPYPGRNATRGYLVGEGQDISNDPMAQAVTRRIMNQHPEWLTRYGVEAVIQVIDDVTQGEEDWEEIGSSDVSAYVNMVRDRLTDWAGSREEKHDRRPFGEQGESQGQEHMSIGQRMARDGITYAPGKERELIELMGEYMQRAGMSPRAIRYYISHDEDWVSDQLAYLPRQGVAEGGYNPLDDERREQRAMDQERRQFKRDELEFELAGEEERYRQIMSGTFYLRINGRIWRRNGEPVAFQGRERAQRAGQTIKDRDPTREVVITRSPQDKNAVTETQDLAEIQNRLAQQFAAEDVLGDMRQRLGDMIQAKAQQRARQMQRRRPPEDVLGEPVRRIEIAPGQVLEIHGNEDDGFRIYRRGLSMPTRFATLEHAQLATRIYESRLREGFTDEEYAQAMRDFLARGGRVEKGVYKEPRLGTRIRRQGSRHIGKGSEGRAGQLAGRGANVGLGGKPVVSVEEENKDACYHKVKSRYRVWPSAYASGALVQCRKKGAKNWGTKS